MSSSDILAITLKPGFSVTGGGLFHATTTTLSTQRSTTYYSGPGGAVAFRRSGYDVDNGVFYLLRDHLGSSSVIVDSSGAIVSNEYYFPYGSNRGVTAHSELTTKRFTGQYHEAGLPGDEGLSYYNARWYDAQLGRFVSADTIVPRPMNPQSFNRMAYTLNNPIRFTDPTGFYTNKEIMKHFGCKTWNCVEGHFQEGGSHEGLKGWLDILQKAVDGDSIRSLLISLGDSDGFSRQSFDGKFKLDSSGKIRVEQVSSTIELRDGKRYEVSYPQSASTFDENAFAAIARNSNSAAGLYEFTPQKGRRFVTNSSIGKACYSAGDCATLALDAGATAASAVAVGCAASVVGAGCAGVAGGVATGLSYAGVGVTAYQKMQGEATWADLVVSGATLGIPITRTHIPIINRYEKQEVGLVASLVQTIWDTMVGQE